MKTFKVLCPICQKTREVKSSSYHSTYYKFIINNLATYNCASCAQKTREDNHHQDGLKKCTICKQWKQLDNFHNDKLRWDKLSPFCKQCNIIKTKTYRENNREKVNAINYKSFKLHKDRVNARASTNYFFPEKQECSVDGCCELGERHHNNYDNYKDITWLCRKHHRELHKLQLMC